jgi:hypothetical protein
LPRRHGAARNPPSKDRPYRQPFVVLDFRHNPSNLSLLRSWRALQSIA